MDKLKESGRVTGYNGAGRATKSNRGHLSNLGSRNNRKTSVLPGQEEARAGGSAKDLSWSCLWGIKIPRDRGDHC